MRTLNDIAVIADPADGLAVYDSTLNGQGNGGWAVIGGTSMSAPIVAGMYALAATGAAGSAASLYNVYHGHNQPLLDVTSGSNGTCPVIDLCNAAPGYDAPTGVGVPWGVGAFQPTGGPGGSGH